MLYRPCKVWDDAILYLVISLMRIKGWGVCVGDITQSNNGRTRLIEKIKESR